jgi:hypothetical protein
MLHFVAVGALVMSSLAAAPTPSPVVNPPTGRVTIDKLKVNGTGCRPDTTAVAVSPDNTAFTVIYSAYQVVSGGSTKPPDARRACSITVRLNVPANLTFAVSQVDYRGFAQLEAGASATQSARYHFQGLGKPQFTTHGFVGAVLDDWQVTDTVPPATAAFGPCGVERKIDIDTELSVSAKAGGPTSLFAMDSTDGAVTTAYHLRWKNCP